MSNFQTCVKTLWVKNWIWMVRKCLKITILICYKNAVIFIEWMDFFPMTWQIYAVLLYANDMIEPEPKYNCSMK